MKKQCIMTVRTVNLNANTTRSGQGMLLNVDPQINEIT